ncbi:MAG TPA: DinB family protein [Pyrinomonadaceae bacterium]|nr:DinB family protein [Pyrinomonadaceae bacterium]
MIYHSIEEIFGALDEARGRLEASVEGVGGGREHFRPAPERWSVADIMEHLAAAEASSLRLFDHLLRKAEAEGRTREGGRPFAPVSIAEHTERSRTEKYQSPEAVRPTGRVPLADSLASLRSSLEALRALRPRIERADCTDLRFPHPAFGPLNLYQWLLFTAAHEDRHRAQIEALKEEMNG